MRRIIPGLWIFFFFNFEGTESINMAVDFFKIVRKRLFFYKNMALFFLIQ